MPIKRLIFRFLSILFLFLGIQDAGAQSVQELQELGEEQVSKGEFELAIATFSNIIRIDPKNAAAYNSRGYAKIQFDQIENGLADLDKAISLDPQLADAWANRGLAYYLLEQWDNAHRNYSKAIELEPGFAWAYNGRGNVNASQKKYDLALQDLGMAISLDAANSDFYKDRGMVYNDKNNPDLAIADFNKAIELNPEAVVAWANRGYSYTLKRQYDLAIKDFSKAIEIDHEFAYAHYQRGKAYMALNKYENAIQDFTMTLSLLPEDTETYVDRGTAYCRANQFELGMNDFKKAISLDPNYARAYSSRGYEYSLKNFNDQSLQDYIQAVTLDPNNGFNYHSRGSAYSKKGQYKLAIDDFNKAISLGYKPASLYASRGYAWSMLYQYENALQDINTAISLEPATVRYYVNRGFYYNNLGRYEEAVADYKTVRAKDAGNAFGYVNIVAPLARLGNYAEAAASYAQYQQKKLTSYIESEKYKYLRSYFGAVSQVAAGKWNEALASIDQASRDYGTELKEETKRGFIDILQLRGVILEKLNRDEEARTIYEQSLVIDNRQPDLNSALERLQQKMAGTRNIDKAGPEITLISPSPSRGFDIVADNAKTQVIGKAKDAGGIASVKINGVTVEKMEDDGLFIHTLALKSGANTIAITATDKQGNSSSKSFIISGTTLTTTVQPKPDQAALTTAASNYYAILIAEKDYDDPGIPDLQNPIKDAKELKSILESKYSFLAKNMDTLYNRSREDIMQAIVQRCNTLGANDNLLIFYAGHGIGEKDQFGDVDGYWIPVSARKDLNATYISADDINKAIKRSRARHILVIADACFSGAFTRALPADATKEIRKQYEVPSRKVMASGNLEPVPDNSKFIFYLKKSLNENTQKYLSAKDLFDGFYKAILSNSDNLPQYAAIKNVGDEGGEFIFVKK